MTIWNLFIYRLPQQPSGARVAAWRELRRIGSLPLGQSVVALPELGDLIGRLDAVESRVASDGGVSWRFRLVDLANDEQERLRSEWNALRRNEYLEVVHECRSTFERQIEFEIFRANFTMSRAEEIEGDLDKLRASIARIRERDWFDAGHDDVDEAMLRCEQLLRDFVERVYLAEASDDDVVELDLPWDRPAGSTDEVG